MEHALYMKEALKEAQKARGMGEVPVGAVIVLDNEIIGRGYNLREINQDAIAHAEIVAIREACTNLNSWRLVDCVMYVTLEPCVMCAGALLQSRIKTLVYGAKDPKAGACGSVVDLLSEDKFNHKLNVVSGVRDKECSNILKDFFSDLRLKKKNSTAERTQE